MTLNHKIRTTSALAKILPLNANFFVGISELGKHAATLKRLGFSSPWRPGESLVPAASLGKNARKNANGWEEIHRDRPMETKYRTVLWTWTMKRGDSEEEDSKIVDVPYKRYPRTFHPPFGLELRITPRTDGSLVVVFPQLQLKPANDKLNITAVNALVEAFGEITIFKDNLDQLIQAPVRNLNWNILPRGQQPWASLKPKLSVVVASRPPQVQQVIWARLEIINSYKPDFFAIGQHGFAGYVVFGFPKKNTFVLESIHLGNATYGLGANWQKLSQMSKGELLQKNLHSFRVVHNAQWFDVVQQYL